MKKILLVILLVLTNLVFVYGEDGLNSKEYIKLNFDSSVDIELNLENRISVDFFEVYSYFFPQVENESLAINSFETQTNNYEIREEDENLFLTYIYNENNLKRNIRSEGTFIIESKFNQPKIKQKYVYPINNIDEDIKKYLEFGGLIDTNSKIQEQASNLANGYDDVFLIASVVAKWIREDVNYDLSTITENPNQKSSEVFESKAGVCKEITNLYVSMMRSLGIPARVVSGFAYTESEEVVDFVGSNWGGHAWAEVYINGEWVPFDLTYNQYGFVDATHIPTYKGAEIKTQSASLSSRGSGYTLVDNSLKADYEFSVIEQRDLNEQIPYEIEISGPKKLAPNSLGHIELNIKNTQDYYQIIFLNLAKVEEVELLDLQDKMIILKPNEEKKAYYRYKIPDLDSNFVYTLPFRIYNEMFEEDFNIEVKENNLLIEELKNFENNQTNVNFSSNIPEFTCSFYLEDEENILLCSVYNKNNFEIKNFEVCSSQDCQNINLNLNGRETLLFQTQKFSENLTFEYLNETISNNYKIDIPDVDYNTDINFEDVVIETNIENYQEGLILEITDNGRLIFDSNSQSSVHKGKFDEGKHTLEAKIYYGNRLISEKEISFETKSPTILQTIASIFKKIGSSFDYIFLQ